MEEEKNHNTTTKTTTATTAMKPKTDSKHTQTQSSIDMDESPVSPLRSNSPFRSDHPLPPEKLPPEKSVSKAIVFVNKNKNNDSHHSPENQKPPPPPPQPMSVNVNFHSASASPVEPEPSPSPVVVFNRSVREELAAKIGYGGGEGGGGGDGGGGKALATILRRSRREVMVKRAELGFRVCEVVLCLISFAVMAADKTQGWSGDSFDRYKEYRYCLSVTVIAFVYSGFQAFDLAHFFITGKHLIQHHLRCHFDFFMDQILAYLLISASSAAASRVDDWQSNWGKDQFTEMASASVGMAFLAFVAFALSSLISGYNLCIRNSA